MSWEESKPLMRACPCGANHYVVISRSDDWGRFDERWEMRCPSCKVEYELYTYYQTHKGMTEVHHGWVPSILLRELHELQKRAEGEKRQLAIYVEAQYAKMWQQHFVGKSKKVVWNELTQDGQRYPSLSTFYSHARNSGLLHVLNGYLHYEDIHTIIRVLKLMDHQLNLMIKEIRALEQQIEQKERYVQQQTVT